MSFSPDFPSVRVVRWSALRWTGWSVMMLLATAVAGYSFVLLANPAARPPFIVQSPVPLAALAHFLFGGIAMLLGPWQFLTGRGARRSATHRLTGYAYAVGAVVGGGAGLVLAPFAQFGTVSAIGFGLLGLGTVATTVIAVLRARARDIADHRRWMVRSYALILAAVTLRFQIPLSLMAGLSFPVVYPIIAWACWVPNALVAEWLVRHRGGVAA